MLLNLLPGLIVTAYCFLQFTYCEASQFDEDYDTVLETLKTERLIHSGSTAVTRSKPCVQVSASEVTVEKAISHLSKKVVEIDPTNKFELAYCGSDTLDEPARCAVESLCTTVYRWKKARTRSMLFGAYKIYVEDKVLLPVSCMCVLGQANKDTGKLISTPIVIL